METVDGFEHRPGDHCGSTCLRNLSEFYGWEFDEPECFGLASGLGFSYLELPVSPWRAFFGRPLDLETGFFENSSVPHDVTEGDGWGAAWSELRESIDDDTPVMLFVDIYYLDYYGTDTHFSPHSVLAVGYDDDSVLLSDNEFDELQELPLESLEKAWSSKHVMPLRNRRLVVTDPEPRRSFEDAAASAIRRTSRRMLDPDETHPLVSELGEHGVPGERIFADDVPNWTELEDVSWCARFAYQNIEKRGTGGGAFRRMYADFLAEVETSLGFGVPTEKMRGISEAWTSLAGTFREASEAENAERYLERASEEIHDIADEEESVFRDLDDL